MIGTTTRTAPQTGPSSAEVEFVGARGRRLWTAVGIAAIALGAAVVAALGPAHGDRATYAWPPSALPETTPERGWYAPLPLLNRVPASITVRIPCGLSDPLRRASESTVVATARRPGGSEALRVARVPGSIEIEVGGQKIGRVPWPSSCPLLVELDDGEVRLPGGTIPLQTGTPGEMPIITGFFSEIDLRAGARPMIVVTTRDYSTSATSRQVGASALAVILALLAFWIASGARLIPQVDRLWPRLGRAWRGLDRADAVVVLVIALWWIIAPAHLDDGWIWAQNRTFGEFGAVTFYFDFWGVISPLGYWLTWLGQWTVGAASDLVLMRLPVVAVLLATWFVCRTCLSLALGGTLGGRARWVLVAAFLVGSVAWGMTLRPEPIVALLAALTLWAMLSFAQAPRTSLLALVLVVLALALSAHPTGIVAAASLVAGLPLVFRTLRASKVLVGTVVALVLGVVALYVVLITVDGDWSHLWTDANIARTGDSHAYSVWDEYIRYRDFDANAGLPLLRLSLALMVLSVGALLTRVRSVPVMVSVLPARSVGIGLASLALIPSKWAWHFGALAALTAVATASELERLVRENEVRPRVIRPVVALVAMCAAVLFAWSDSYNLTAVGDPIGLQEVAWHHGFNGYTLLAAGVLVVGIAVATIATKRAQALSTQLASIATWSLTGLSSLVIAITIGLYAVDAARSSWSPARDNLEALAGAGNCGLAEQMSDDAAAHLREPTGTTLVHPAVGAYFPCATIPRISRGLVEIPTAIVTHWYWNVLERDSPFTAAEELYGIRPTAGKPFHGVDVDVVSPVVPGYSRADAIAISADGH